MSDKLQSILSNVKKLFENSGIDVSMLVARENEEHVYLACVLNITDEDEVRQYRRKVRDIVEEKCKPSPVTGEYSNYVQCYSGTTDTGLIIAALNKACVVVNDIKVLNNDWCLK